jgi:predicted AAA+ superfamily ATPase
MIERNIWNVLKKELDKKEAIVLTGPRQVGKTTTLKWLLSHVKDNKIYLDLTLESTEQLFNYSNYNNIANQLQGMGLDFSKRATIAIDEIQYSKNIPRIIKYLYDSYDIKFILTGSSSYYLKNHFIESLSGRKLIFEMLPLSFDEFVKFQNVKYKAKPINLNEPKKWCFDKFAYETLNSYYEEYIEFGGFPAIAMSEGKERKKQMLDVIYSSYINMDVQQLADFKSTTELKKLIKLLGARVGSRLNIDELSKIVGLSRPTISNYLSFLEQTYLIKLVPAFSGSADVRERLPKKVYFIDTGIANINADLSGGAKFENTVCHQLGFFGKLFFYNGKNGEIDFIMQREKSNIAIEVKETPINDYMQLAEKHAKKIDISEVGLVGRFYNKKFSNYMWGGGICQ